MKDKIKKKTGAFRAGMLTALFLLIASLFFSVVSVIVTALLLRFGTPAIYVGILVNVAGAAFAAWAGASFAMIGREMNAGKSSKAAIIAAFIPSVLNLASGIIGGVFTAMAGRGGSYTATIAESISFFVVIFFISRAVFRRKEANSGMPQGKNLASTQGNG